MTVNVSEAHQLPHIDSGFVNNTAGNEFGALQFAMR